MANPWSVDAALLASTDVALDPEDNMRVLVVENNRQLARLLEQGL